MSIQHTTQAAPLPWQAAQVDAGKLELIHTSAQQDGATHCRILDNGRVVFCYRPARGYPGCFGQKVFINRPDNTQFEDPWILSNGVPRDAGPLADLLSFDPLPVCGACTQVIPESDIYYLTAEECPLCQHCGQQWPELIAGNENL